MACSVELVPQRGDERLDVLALVIRGNDDDNLHIACVGPRGLLVRVDRKNSLVSGDQRVLFGCVCRHYKG